MKAKRQKKAAVKSAKSVKKAKTKVVAKSQGKSVENQIAMKMQKDVAAAIAAYMDKHNIGFNEFARRLGTSATQMQKIQKGSANLTFTSLAHIAAVMKKKVKLTLI